MSLLVALCLSHFCDTNLGQLNAAQEFTFDPFVVSCSNHNLVFINLELQTVREVAPIYFGIGQVLEGKCLLLQVLDSEQLHSIRLRLDYVIIRCHDPLDLAYVLIAD